SRLMFDGPGDELTATQNAQPAILAHSAAVFAVVGPTIDGAAVAAAGHSLGEYSAYIAAGALAPTDAAALVRRRGELMQQAGTERPGTMAAVLGLATAEVEEACRAASSGGAVVVAANLNAPDQTVISGDPDAVAKAGAARRRAGRHGRPFHRSRSGERARRAVAAHRPGCECHQPGHRGRRGDVSRGAMKIDLAGKVAVVTGGSRGIGHAIAQALAVAGA